MHSTAVVFCLRIRVHLKHVKRFFSVDETANMIKMEIF